MLKYISINDEREIKEMTPCEELGYKAGDLFEVVGSDAGTFSPGSKIELYRDDATDAPLFKLITGECNFKLVDEEYGAYITLDFIKPLQKKGENVKLKYKLWVEGNSVSFQVLEMDERFRETADKYIEGHRSELLVGTCRFPELLPHVIYLRGGDLSKDDRVTSLSFDTPEEAHEYAAKVHRSLKDWSENWEGWVTPAGKEDEVNTFTL